MHCPSCGSSVQAVGGICVRCGTKLREGDVTSSALSSPVDAPSMSDAVITPIIPPSATVSTGASSVSASAPSAPAAVILATPWPRYWARSLDTLLGCAPIAFAAGWLAPGLLDFGDAFPGRTGDQIFWMILLPFAMVTDALIYAGFGNTLGKWLAGIKVRNIAGSKLSFAQYLRRNFHLWFSGLALGIGIIALFTFISNHRRVKTGHLTSWDHAVESRVLRVRGGIGRTTVTACFYVVLIGSLAALGFSASKTPERQLQDIAATVTPEMVDKDTRLDGASAGPGRVLNYNYTLIFVSADDLNLATVNSNLQGSLRQELVQTFCNSWAARGLRALDLTIRYRYFDKNGQLIGTIETSKRDCPK